MAAFKACPTRFRFGYVEGVRLATDTDSQRMGTNWHALQEDYQNKLAVSLAEGCMPEDAGQIAWQHAIDHLNKAYEEIPNGVTANAWAIERAILAYSFAGYVWYYSADTYRTVATEIPFRLPLHHPKTGMPLSSDDVLRVGKIDRMIERGTQYVNVEYKSTASSIAPESDYWAHLRLDTQVGMYVAAARDLQASDQLPGVPADAAINGTLYDVWHKPQISPKMLTQGDTKTVIETGQYFDTLFTVEVKRKTNTPVQEEVKGKMKDVDVWAYEVEVDGVDVEVEAGKKEDAFAIRETPEMFGARLLADIYERPAFYFRRQEITRTDAEIRGFRVEMYNIYQNMKGMEATGHYFHNEQQCEATFKCPYIPICYHQRDAAVLAGETPEGFKRIFTDLTVGATT